MSAMSGEYAECWQKRKKNNISRHAPCIHDDIKYSQEKPNATNIIESCCEWLPDPIASTHAVDITCVVISKAHISHSLFNHRPNGNGKNGFWNWIEDAKMNQLIRSTGNDDYLAIVRGWQWQCEESVSTASHCMYVTLNILHLTPIGIIILRVAGVCNDNPARVHAGNQFHATTGDGACVCFL